MSTNMTLIETKTVGSGGAADIEFTSIPQTYTDLYLVCSLRMTEAGTDNWAMLTFNNIGGTSNNAIFIRGNGSTAVSSSGLNADFMRGVIANGATSTASTFASGSVYIPNYTSTTTNKSASIESAMENNATYGYLPLTAALVTNTAAVTSIKLVPFSGTWVQHSSASLYGISNVTSTTKATGGIVSSDGTYNYHMFPYSGTFTPTQAITAEILAIGGGGGTGNASGGGGAGGVIYDSSESLTAQAYTVTIGAGGTAGTSGAGNKGTNTTFGSLITANGGGAGRRTNSSDSNGGSGGGVQSGQTAGTASAGSGGTGYANAGAAATGTNGGYGGGGGAGAAGGLNTGGNGLNTWSTWANATQTGINGYYAGGGAGPQDTPNPNSGVAGGLGGGGASGSKATGTATGGVAGAINTGSGAGGGGIGTTADGAGAAGGSGLVIIRYAI